MVRITLSLIMALLFAGSVNLTADNESGRWIQVSGDSEITAEPDEVSFWITIQSEDKTQEEAKQANNKKFDSIVAILDLFSISRENITETNFSIYPRYKSSDKDELKGYAVARYLKIKVEDIKLYESVIDALAEAGIDRISRVDFGSSQKKELLIQAREMALDKAKQKAEQMAGVYNMKLGNPIFITDGSSPEAKSLYDYGGGAFSNVATSSVSFRGAEEESYGKEIVRARVFVRFELLE